MAGSAVGDLGRYWLARLLDDRLLQPLGQFPIGTITVNVVGSLLITCIGAAWARERPWLQLLVLVGVMGGFTTFSSFSHQVLALVRSERIGIACSYIALSLVVGVLAAAAGSWVGRALGAR